MTIVLENGTEPRIFQLSPELAELKLQISCFYALQEHRIKAGNRIFALSEFLDVDQDRAKSLHARIIGGNLEGVKYSGILEVEERIGKDIKKLVDAQPLWQLWLKDVKGIGPIFAGGWMSAIGDPAKFDNVGKLWAYAGLHTVPANTAYVEKFIDNPRIRAAVEAGAVVGDPNNQDLRMMPRRERGKRANWSPFMRTLAWKTGGSFVKSKGPYREFYDRYRARYEITRPETTDAHRFAMAKRKTVKLFLSHLWEAWRLIEGLPVRQPWALEYGGHTTYIEIPNFDRNLLGSIPND
jgi:hypothetical protein